MEPDEPLSDAAKRRIAAEEEFRLGLRRRLEGDHLSSLPPARQPLPVHVVETKGKNGCLIAILVTLCILGVLWPPFFLMAVGLGVMAAIMKFLKQ